MLQLKNVNSGYGTRQILYDLSMNVKKGSITVIIGPNGAGKTTLLRTIMGLIDIYSGEILFEGKNIVGMPTNKIVRLGVSYIPQRNNIFEELTVRENLLMGGYLLKKDEREARMEEVLELFPVLGRKDYINRKASRLSGGERRMLALAKGLMKKPKLILLDEPTEGLMPKLTMEVYDKIKEIHQETGAQIIMTEEKAQFALELGDDAFLLVSGQIQDHRSAKEMLNDPDLREKYFGILGVRK
ncbi:MAG TPA: ABC transporter ATP-binding protein [Candidatus Korarchaeota archaeon]|nr:ABC transporter ATP-binding protein [Candidatus Korarchaeota archaeon]